MRGIREGDFRSIIDFRFAGGRGVIGVMLLLLACRAGAMEFVAVGDPGNKADPLYGYGSVPYVFEIGKYEVTNGEYVEFLNAVASEEDPYGLYNPSMSVGLFGGISRIGDGYPCRYEAKPGWERRPVVYLSWYDVARLANWFHYGCPKGGSRPGTTEGTDSGGAYDTRAFPRDPRVAADPERLPARRNAGALYWIPSEDEWYKAAYYDPAISYGKRPYWDFPTRSSNPPGNPPPPGDAHSANFFSKVFAAGKPYFLTEAGSYPQALSPYGTCDQGGNAWEWIENWRRKGTGWRDAEAARGLRGGSATYNFVGLHAANTDPGNPSHEMFVFGGRLARAAKAADGRPVLSTEPKTAAAGWRQSIKTASRKKILAAGLGAGALGGFALGLLLGGRMARRKGNKI